MDVAELVMDDLLNNVLIMTMINLVTKHSIKEAIDTDVESLTLAVLAVSPLAKIWLC